MKRHVIKVLTVGFIVGLLLYGVILPEIRNAQFRHWTSQIVVGMSKAEVKDCIPESANGPIFLTLIADGKKLIDEDRWGFRSFAFGGKTHPLQLEFYCDFVSNKVLRTALYRPDN